MSWICIGCVVQNVLMAWNACTKRAWLGNIQKGEKLFVLQNNSKLTSGVIENREHGYAPQPPGTRFLFTDTSIKLDLNSANNLVQEVLDRTDAVDEALRYLATEIFNAMHELLGNSDFNFMGWEEQEVWIELSKYSVREGIIPPVLCEMPLFLLPGREKTFSSHKAS